MRRVGKPEAWRGVRLDWIPAAIAILPAVGVHTSYLLAAAQGHVPWCLVYLDGCTSISSTGRMAPERFVFLSAVLPAAALLLVFWRLNVVWLRRLRGRSNPADRILLVLGLASGLALIVYLVFLGAPGAGARLARRISVATFFVALYAGQVALTWQVVALRSRMEMVKPAWLWVWATLCLLVLVGIVWSLLLLVVRDDFRELEDAFEWSLTVLIFAHVLVTGTVWHESGFVPRIGMPRASQSKGPAGNR